MTQEYVNIALEQLSDNLAIATESLKNKPLTEAIKLRKDIIQEHIKNLIVETESWYNIQNDVASQPSNQKKEIDPFIFILNEKAILMLSYAALMQLCYMERGYFIQFAKEIEELRYLIKQGIVTELEIVLDSYNPFESIAFLPELFMIYNILKEISCKKRLVLTFLIDIFGLLMITLADEIEKPDNLKAIIRVDEYVLNHPELIHFLKDALKILLEANIIDQSLYDEIINAKGKMIKIVELP